jgi:bifunctional DNase/RNase
MGEVRVVGIRIEQPQNQPVLLLRESNGDRYLPIWIGQGEASAIALEQQGVEPVRPQTHDLIRDLIAALGHSLKEVRIVDLQEGTFYADLVFDRDITVSARPSDSVAIALRVGVPIYVEEAVLAEAGLLIPDEGDEESPRGRGGEVQGVPRQRVAGRLQGHLIRSVRVCHGCVSTGGDASTRGPGFADRAFGQP